MKNYYKKFRDNYDNVLNYYSYLMNNSKEFDIDINNELIINYYDYLIKAYEIIKSSRESILKNKTSINSVYKIINNLVVKNNYNILEDDIIKGLSKYQKNYRFLKINEIRNIKNVLIFTYIDRINNYLKELSKSVENYKNILEKYETKTSFFDYLNNIDDIYIYDLYNFFNDKSIEYIKDIEVYLKNNNKDLKEVIDRVENRNININITINNIFSSIRELDSIDTERLIEALSFLDKSLRKNELYVNSSTYTKNLYRDRVVKVSRNNEFEYIKKDIYLKENINIKKGMLIYLFVIFGASSLITYLLVYFIGKEMIFSFFTNLYLVLRTTYFFVNRYNKRYLYKYRESANTLLLASSKELLDILHEKFKDNKNIKIGSSIKYKKFRILDIDLYIKNNNIKYIGYINNEIDILDISNSISYISHPLNDIDVVDLTSDRGFFKNIFSYYYIKMFLTNMFNRSFVSDNYIIKVGGDINKCVSISSSLNNYPYVEKSNYFYKFVYFNKLLFIFNLLSLLIIVTYLFINKLYVIILMYVFLFSFRNFSKKEKETIIVSNIEEKNDKYYENSFAIISNGKMALEVDNNIKYYNNKGFLYGLSLLINDKEINIDKVKYNNSNILVYSKYMGLDIIISILVLRDVLSSLISVEVVNNLKKDNYKIELKLNLEHLENNISSNVNNVNKSLIVKRRDYVNKYYMISNLSKYRCDYTDDSIIINKTIMKNGVLKLNFLSGYSTLSNNLNQIRNTISGFDSLKNASALITDFYYKRNFIKYKEEYLSIYKYLKSNSNSHKLEYLKKSFLPNEYLIELGFSYKYIVTSFKELAEAISLRNYLKYNLEDYKIVVFCDGDFESIYKTDDIVYKKLNDYTDDEINLIYAGSSYIIGKDFSYSIYPDVCYKYIINKDMFKSIMGEESSGKNYIAQEFLYTDYLYINEQLLNFSSYKEGFVNYSLGNIKVSSMVTDKDKVYIISVSNRKNESIDINVRLDIDINKSYYMENGVFVNYFDDRFIDTSIYVHGEGFYKVSPNSLKTIIVSTGISSKKYSLKSLDKYRYKLPDNLNIYIDNKMINDSISNSLYDSYIKYLDNVFPYNVRYLMDTDLFVDNKEEYLKLLGLVFKTGEVLYSYNYYRNTGVRSKKSGINLILLQGVINYIKIHGDDILSCDVRYINSDLVSSYTISDNVKIKDDGKASVFEHMIKLLEFSLDSLGEHGLPTIDAGDLFDNDFLKVINGESVLLGLILLDILKSLKNISGFSKYDKYYNEIKNNLDEAIDEYYIRSYIDGEKIGSVYSSEGKLYLTVSNRGLDVEDDYNRILSIVNACEKYLVKENKIYSIDIPYDKSLFIPGDMIKYKPYYKINGGINNYESNLYISHLFRFGYLNKAYRYLENVKIEFLTIKTIIGLDIINNKLIIKPRLSKEIGGARIIYKYKNTIYKIEIVKRDYDEIVLNGKVVSEIELIDDQKVKEITVCTFIK